VVIEGVCLKCVLSILCICGDLCVQYVLCVRVLVFNLGGCVPSTTLALYLAVR